MQTAKPYSPKGFSPKAGRDSPNQITRSASSFSLASFSLRVQKKPAIFALIIQGFSLLVVLLLCRILLHLSVFFSFGLLEIPLLAFLIMQAVTASTFSHVFGMAIWWRWIHVVFPIALWATLKLDVPNEVYLVGFLLTLSIFWSTYRTQVPYYPSRLDVWQRMSALVGEFEMKHRHLPQVIDIGSGLGGLSLYLAQHHRDIKVAGIEIAPLPWLVSRLRSVVAQAQVRFTLGDYQALNFADYDIIFAYLSPAAMPALWEKARQEMRPNTLLVSLEFAVPDVEPMQRLPQKGQNRELYIYEL